MWVTIQTVEGCTCTEDPSTRYGIIDGYGTTMSGDCVAVTSLNIWLHLGINILSTFLLTASNTFMAVYCCRSRKEIDKAHSDGKSLHIGNLSSGNLRSIAKGKAVVVLLLAMTSIPFHLFLYWHHDYDVFRC